MADRDAVIEKLKAIAAPEGGGNIVDRGLVSDIFIADGKVYFSITVPADRAQALDSLRLAAEKAVASIPGVSKAVVALTAQRQGQANAGRTPPRPAPAVHAHAHANHAHGQAHRPTGRQAGTAPGKQGVPGIERIIAVASGKGGVGKSTTAVNLALGLAALGLRIGILDADVYGPSLPRLLNLNGKPQAGSDGKKLKPMRAYGVAAMSMGFLVDEDTPMIWRGPMVMSALTQMLREVEWGELDLLIVDMPPGTGDAQLTLAQQSPLAGAVIVSTPQDLALIDARKGLNMFRRVEVPVLGIIENMSYFLCPDCGGRHDVFGHGGARAEAEKLGVPFLGEVPLAMTIRETSDAGRPVVAGDPEGPHARIYREIAARVLEQLDFAVEHTEAPSIVFE